MITTRTNETIQGQLYHEWLNNLSMYHKQLEHLLKLVTGANNHGIQLDASIELEALADLIKVQQQQIEGLSAEVMLKIKHLKPVDEANEGIIAFAEVIINNQLRERIRKAEHSVFYLKHHVNKLLSIAS
jgi:hypothetical protein